MPREQYSEGTIKRDDRGNWLGEWYVYEEVDGVRRRRRRTKVITPKTLTRPEAREKLREKVMSSRGLAPPVQPADSLMALWDRYVTFKSGDWSKHTVATMQSIMKSALDREVGDWKLGHIALKSLTLDPLQSVINAMARDGLSPSSIKNTRIYLKAMLEYAVDEKMIPANPGRKLKLPKRMKEPNGRYYSLDEVHLLLSRATGRDHLVLRLFFVGGLRPAELFALRVNDIRPGEIYVDEALKQGETGDDRIGDPKTPESENGIPIPDSLEQEVRIWISSQDLGKDSFLFPTSKGTAWHPMNYLRRHLRRIIAKPGAEFNKKTGDWNQKDLLIPDLDYRAMRRTCATYFRNNLTAAQRQLRHTTPMVTARHYRKTISEEQRAAVEALDRELCPQHTNAVSELGLEIIQ